MKAHAANIVHRDLKPENIHLCTGEDGDEIAKILDFGLAKFYSPVKTDEKTARLTREGAVFGTPAYMSPEQVRGQGSVDHRADLWALGCMTFECLTGRPVWNTDQGVAMTFAAHRGGAAPRAEPHASRPAADVRRLVPQGARSRPRQALPDAKELAEDLAKALGAHISLANAGTPSQIELVALSQSPDSIANLQERGGAADDTVKVEGEASRSTSCSRRAIPPSAPPTCRPPPRPRARRRRSRARVEASRAWVSRPWCSRAPRSRDGSSTRRSSTPRPPCPPRARASRSRPLSRPRRRPTRRWSRRRRPSCPGG